MQVAYDVYAQRKYLEVQQDTWGHLAPKQDKKYTGYFTFAAGCYGGIELLIMSCVFDGLDDSPWFFEALNVFIDTLDAEAGHVYKFTGTYCNGMFNGSVVSILDANKSNSQNVRGLVITFIKEFYYND